MTQDLAIEARNIGVTFKVDGGQIEAVKDVSFTLKKGQKVLMVEDIVSTGVSSRECIAAIKKNTGAKVVAACCLIDRSGGKAKVGVPLIALAEWKVQAWPADKLPPHLRGTKAVKPGSRGLA